MKIFSGSSNKLLAEKIAHNLNLELSPLEIFVFPDKEKRVRVEESVLEENTVIVQSTSTPAESNYMELFLITDSLKRSGAKSITAVISYLGYQRQDHIFRDGEGVSLDVVIRIMESIGITKVISFDLHSIKIPELFHLPIAHLSALPLFAAEIKKNKLDPKNTVLVSPDMGGIRRIEILAELLNNMKYATIVKNRDLATGKVESDEIQGEVKENVVIVDDMIASGLTIEAAVNLVKKHGAKNIFVFATHGVLSKEAPDLLNKLDVKEICITDSVFVSKEKHFSKLKIITISDLIAKEINSK